MSCNIDKESHTKMVQDIGALALNSLHHYLASTKIRKTDQHNSQQHHYAQSPELEARQDYILTAKKILSLLPSIEKMPLRNIQKQAGWIAKEKAVLYEQGIKAFIKQPHRTKIQTQQLSESLDCSENQLLLWIIQTVYQHLSKSLPQQYGTVFFATSNTELLKAQDNENKELCTKLKNAQHSYLFNNVTRVNTPPSPTERMLGSLGYAEIYHTFQQKILQNTSIYTLKLALAKIKVIENLPIHKDAKIYEIWCFIQLYFAFVKYANFKPTQNILDLLEIHDNNLRFKEGCCFELTRNNIKIKLFYEKELITKNVQHLKPDFFIELYYPNHTKPLAFIFDAKWRKYQDMPHDDNKCNQTDQKGYNCIACDAYQIAYKKYWSTLKEVNNYQLVSSFILHSDNTEPKYEHWNGFNLFRWLSQFEGYKDIFNKEKPQQGHSVGAIALRPNEKLNNALSRLIYLMLLYHLGNVWPNADNLCPQCGEVSITNGQYHSCTYCKLKWHIRKCPQDSQHRIIDMGDAHKSLHVIETGNKKMKCPICDAKVVR